MKFLLYATLYKCLNNNRMGLYSQFQWPPCGQWTKKIRGPLVECVNGFHLCTASDLLSWLQPEIYEAEGDGDSLIGRWNSIVFRRARLIRRLRTWNQRTARLFACDCVEHVYRNVDSFHCDEQYVSDPIHVARNYAKGKISLKECARFAAQKFDILAKLPDEQLAIASPAWNCASPNIDLVLSVPMRLRDGLLPGKIRHGCFSKRRYTKIFQEEYFWQTNRLLQYLYPRRNHNEDKKESVGNFALS